MVRIFPKESTGMITYASINGEIIPVEQAVLPVTDLSILRGFGIFDYFLVKKGHPVFFEDYLERFTRSAALMDLELPLPGVALREGILALVRANGLLEASIRLVLTGGLSEDGYSPAPPNLIILEHPYPHANPAYYSKGISLLTHDYQREFPEVKTINYLTGIRLLNTLKSKGAHELLYCNGNKVRESARSNFMLLTADKVLVSPDEQILAGITRKKVLELATDYVKVEVREVLTDELLTASEAYLTSTTKGVMPVTTIDGRPVGAGKPGETGKVLHAAFLRATSEYLAQKVDYSTQR